MPASWTRRARNSAGVEGLTRSRACPDSWISSAPRAVSSSSGVQAKDDELVAVVGAEGLDVLEERVRPVDQGLGA